MRARSRMASAEMPLRHRALRLAVCLIVCAAFATGQTNSTTRVKNFVVPEYYDPPHEMQLKTLLQGAEAQPGVDGRILISVVKLQSFAQNGQTQMLVEAPYCTFDSVRRTVQSPGPLSLRSANGKVLLEGEGFLWEQTNSNLIISNHVRTVIRNTPDKLFTP